MTGFRFQDLIPLMAAEGRISLLPLKYKQLFFQHQGRHRAHAHTHAPQTRSNQECTSAIGRGHTQMPTQNGSCGVADDYRGKEKKKRSSLLAVSPQFSLAERCPASLGQEIKMWAACGGVWEVAEFISRIFFGPPEEADAGRLSPQRDPSPNPGRRTYDPLAVRPQC